MLKKLFIFAFGFLSKPEESYEMPSNVAITGFDVSIDSIHSNPRYQPNSCGTEHPKRCILSDWDITLVSKSAEITDNRPNAFPKSLFG